MTRYYNRQEQKPMRQTLRNSATKAERLLWWRLRNSQLDGFKFRRQYGVGSYVVDLYCPEAKLAIEVDGESHFDPASRVRDESREAYLKSFGIHVMRFTNPQVYEQIDWVIDEIWHAAKERGANSSVRGHRPPLIPPYQGGRQNAHEARDKSVGARDKSVAQAPLLIKEGVGGGRDSVAHAIFEKDPPQSPLSKGGGS